MRQEAEMYAEQDRRRIEIIRLQNQADNLIYDYESTFNEQQNLIRDDLKAKMARLKSEFQIAVKKFDVNIAELEKILEQIRQTLLEIGTDLYQNTSSEPENNIFSANAEIDMLEKDDIKALVSVPKEGELDIDSSGTVSGETVFEDYEALD